MSPRLQGATELDGGPLSALSESYFTTNPNGSYAIVRLQGELDLNAFREAMAHAQRQYPSLAMPLEEQRRGLQHYLIRKPLQSLPDLEVCEVGATLNDANYLETVRQLIDSQFDKPFELFDAAPARFLLLCFADNNFSFVMNAHHSCADGYVLVHFLQTLMEHYHCLVNGTLKAHSPSAWIASRKNLSLKPNYRANTRSVLRDMRLRRRPLMKRRRELNDVDVSKPYYAAWLFSVEESHHIIKKAKRYGISVNDLLNITIIKVIDEIRAYPNALMSVCYPINLRLYMGGGGRHGNLTSGFYINLPREQRRNDTELIQNFVAEKARLFGQGRAYYNLILLQKVFRILRLFPHKRRLAWLHKLGAYPATFICSNLGNFHFNGPAGQQRVFGKNLRMTDADILFYPNRNTDYLVLALTYNDSLKVCISADHRVVEQEETEQFRKQLRCQLLQ